MAFENLIKGLSEGLLSFPITDMDEKGDFDPVSYAERIRWFVSYDISTVFVAGGTGEFFSLSEEEYREIVKIGVEQVNGKVPVISSIGRSIPEAIQYARIAEEAGIDGLLLMPPYLTDSPADGIVAYAKAIMDNTDLPVIYYNRANGTLKAREIEILARDCPNLVGLKDGTGQIHELNDIIKTVGDRLVYIGGVPTAEIISEAYLAIGVTTYSSAVFNFVPELALSFYSALRNGENDKVEKILKDFFIPFVRLRNRSKGYAVSLIKEGAKIIGRPAGNVRAPLVMPTEDESKSLAELIKNLKY